MKTSRCPLSPLILLASLCIALPFAAGAHPGAPVPLGEQFHVVALDTNNHGFPSVAVQDTGEFVIVWNSGTSFLQEMNLASQWYTNAGEAVGSELQVNQYTTGSQVVPVCLAMPNNEVVVVYVDSSNQLQWNVMMRRFASDGQLSGSEFQVSSIYHGNQLDISAAPNGNFIVVWRSSFPSNSSHDIVARLFDSQGVPSGSEFLVNSYTTYSQTYPAVASTPDGDFLVVWETLRWPGGEGGEVVGRLVTSSGSFIGSDFVVNSVTTDQQYGVDVAANDEGEFTVVWSSWAGVGSNVRAKRFTSSGQELGTEFAVDSFSTGGNSRPAVVMTTGGSFVVAWSGDHAPVDSDPNVHIQARAFNRSGDAIGGQFEVNPPTPLWSYLGGVAADDRGRFVVVWVEQYYSNNPEDIFARRFILPYLFEDGFETGDWSAWAEASLTN